jgi:acyl-CoA hydrolase
LFATIAPGSRRKLSAVAHPDHRDWLRDEVRRRYHPSALEDRIGES